MVKAVAFLVVFFLSQVLSAQPAKNKSPFIVEGQIKNYQGQKLSLQYWERDRFINALVKADRNGRFYLKITNLTQPVEAIFGRDRQSLTKLNIAPGYHLFLSGNDELDGSFFRTKQITGIGSVINRYNFVVEKDTTTWYTLNENDLLQFVHKNEVFRDSAYHAFFDTKIEGDPYAAWFKKVAHLDNIFIKLNYLLTHVDDSLSYSYDKSIAFVKRYFNHDDIFNNLFDPGYIISGEYGYTLINEYADFLRILKCKKDPSWCDKKEYSLEIIRMVDSAYSGEIRQRTLYRRMQSSLRHCRSFEELNNYKENYPVYISELHNKEKRDELSELLSSKGEELAGTQIGLPAPAFSVTDSAGKLYTLDNFKGQVIYIDLWGSWCVPCRKFTPVLKTFYEKFKNEKKLRFISIAVFDKSANWKKAILEDTPTWLQLFDSDGVVAKNYVASSVPKFILINKQGNIVSFDAVMPDKMEELESLLNEEMGK